MVDRLKIDPEVVPELVRRERVICSFSSPFRAPSKQFFCPFSLSHLTSPLFLSLSLSLSSLKPRNPNQTPVPALLRQLRHHARGPRPHASRAAPREAPGEEEGGGEEAAGGGERNDDDDDDDDGSDNNNDKQRRRRLRRPRHRRRQSRARRSPRRGPARRARDARLL